MNMSKRIVSMAVIFTFICSLGPLPSAMALRSTEAAEGKTAKAVGADIKVVDASAVGNVVEIKAVFEKFQQSGEPISYIDIAVGPSGIVYRSDGMVVSLAQEDSVFVMPPERRGQGNIKYKNVYVAGTREEVDVWLAEPEHGEIAAKLAAAAPAAGNAVELKAAFERFAQSKEPIAVVYKQEGPGDKVLRNNAIVVSLVNVNGVYIFRDQKQEGQGYIDYKNVYVAGTQEEVETWLAAHSDIAAKVVTAAQAVGVTEAIARVEAALATLPEEGSGLLAADTVRRQLSQLQSRLESMRTSGDIVISDQRLEANINSYCTTAETWAAQTTAQAAGLSVTLPADIVVEVTAKVEALRETLPIIMIYKGSGRVAYGERPLKNYGDEGFSYKVPNSSERAQVFNDDIFYRGADVRNIAAKEKALIIANTQAEAEAKKAEIVALEGTGLKPENIKIAASAEEVTATIAAEPAGFDFVVRVGTISFEAQLQAMPLPKVSVEYNSEKLRKSLEDATLASSV